MVASSRILFVVVGLASASVVGVSLCASTLDIKDVAGLSSISACVDLSGKVTIRDVKSVRLPNLERVTGELGIEGSSVNEIIFDKLAVAKRFSLKDVAVAQLDLKLKAVGTLTLNDLKGGSLVHFTEGLASADVIRVIDSDVTSLEGFNFESIKTLEIVSNIYLKSLSLPNLTKIEGTLRFRGNNMASLSAPKLSIVREDVDISVAGGLDLSKLDHVKQLSIAESGGEAYKFPALHSVDKVVLYKNAKLKSIEFPELKAVKYGGMDLSSNGALTTVKLPLLSLIQGGLNINAPTVTELQLNEKLRSDGGARIETRVACDKFDKFKSQFKEFTCIPPGVIEAIPPSAAPETKPGAQTPVAPGQGSAAAGSAIAAAVPTLSAFVLALLATFY